MVKALHEKGCVVLSVDFNSRIGTSVDFIEYDSMATELNNFISPVINYNYDVALPERKSQDLVVNSFGRKLLELCRSTGTRVCNGRTFGDKDGRYTFFNHRGVSVNDFAIVSENFFHVVNYFHVENFNEWSDHAPLHFQICIQMINSSACSMICCTLTVSFTLGILRLCLQAPTSPRF